MENRINQELFTDLTPTSNKADKNKTYFDSLNWALNNDSIYNIAITGIYGSGKSSIIKTFISELQKETTNATHSLGTNSRYDINKYNFVQRITAKLTENKAPKFFTVSLASFDTQSSEQSACSQNSDSSSNDTRPIPSTSNLRKKVKNVSEASKDTSLSQQLEIGILQQLLYQFPSSKLPFSRFHRIQNISKCKFFLCFNITTLVLLLTAALIWPVVIKKFFSNTVNSFASTFLFQTWFVKILFLVALLGILSIIGYLTWIFVQKLSVHAVSLEKAGARIEIGQNDRGGAFNKYLDEILYFFETTAYSIVVFEDIDRFDNTEIFIKLRELNQLINNYKNINRKIRFIYAIKDDLLHDSLERTKFFDFIIPVVPALSSYNAYQKLKSKLVNEEISGEYLDDIAPFINDTRLMYNIINEYAIYKNELHSIGLSHEKLFSMILYKNVFPKDFSQLQQEQGILFNIFSRKEDFVKTESDKLRSAIDLIENALEQSKQEPFAKRRELNAAFLSHFPHRNSLTVYYQTPQSIKSHNHLDFLDYNESYSMITRLIYSGSQHYDLKKNDEPLKSLIDLFQLRLEALNNNEHGKITELIQMLKKQKKALDAINNSSLAEVLSNNHSLANDAPELILFLLRRGYIDESYQNYISYFYEGDLLPGDMRFILMVKQCKTLPANFALSNPIKVLDRLDPRDFLSPAILNFSICREIFSGQGKEYADLLLDMLCTDSETSNQFILDYWKQCTLDQQTDFISTVGKEWDRLWHLFYQTPSLSIDEKRLVFLQIHKNVPVSRIIGFTPSSEFSKFALQQEDYLSLVCSVPDEIIKEFITSFDLQFDKLKVAECSPVVDYIFKNCYFAINPCMLKTALQLYSHAEVNDCSYTTIKDSGISWLINYVEKNIDAFIKNVDEVEQYTIDSIKHVKHLLNDCDALTENKAEYLSRKQICFDDLNEISKEFWSELLDQDKVNPTLDNLQSYFESNSYNCTLSSFIGRNANKIVANTPDNNAATYSVLQKILADDNLTLDQYRMLIKLGKFFELSNSPKDYLELSEDKLTLLITNKIIALSKENYSQLKQGAFKTKLHLVLLSCNQNDYIQAIHKYPLDVNDYFSILSEKSRTFTRQTVRILMASLDTNITAASKVIASATLNTWLRIAYNEKMPVKLVDALLSTIEDETLVIRLLLHAANHSTTDELKSYLKNAAEPFNSILVFRARPKLKSTTHSTRFVKILEASEIISSYKLQNTSAGPRIIIYTKKNA